MEHTQHNLFKLTSAIRQYFNEQEFIEVFAPPIVENPGMETHLHPFQVKGVYPERELPLYLHTSPEFFMKKLLSEGLEKIYNLSFSFRDEPDSETHRKQFLMLEWYRAHSYYDDIKKDCDQIISKSFEVFDKNMPSRQTVTVNELFQEKLKFLPTDFLDVKDFKEKVLMDFPNLVKPHEDIWPWEDYFFVLFLNLIEPDFKSIPYLMVDEFPAPLAALSTLSKNDQKVCERFEIYLSGTEVANCFNELTDFDIQKDRFDFLEKSKKELYNYQLNEPKEFYKTLKKGIPKASGIALGIERLLMSILGRNHFID